MKYQIDPARVSYEHIQDETIVIDFETGTYFSIGGAGCDIWEQLVDGLDTSAILRSALRSYDGKENEVEEGIRHFLEELEREQLISKAGEDPQPAPGGREATETTKREYLRPILGKYTDMKDLLLLDPIHEVDDRGWPMEKPAP